MRNNPDKFDRASLDNMTTLHGLARDARREKHPDAMNASKDGLPLHKMHGGVNISTDVRTMRKMLASSDNPFGFGISNYR